MRHLVCGFAVVLVFSVQILAFDWPWKDSDTPKTNKDAVVSNEKEVDYDKSQPVVTTYLDTLNNGNEIALSTKDITPIVVAADAPTERDIVEQDVTPNAAPVATSTPSPRGMFRVQCLATTDIERARAEKKLLEARTEFRAYIVSDQPFYKIQVGDFPSRAAAQGAQADLSNLGYNDAWIIAPQSN